MRREERGPWYLLTGLVLGVVIGLLYAWQVQPTRYVDTSPASLRTDFKDRYRALIAAAYTANNDLLRAQARLELLEDEDAYRALAEQAQRTLAEGRDPDEARALGLLAVSLGQGGLPTANQAPSSPSPATASPSPTGSLTPALTLTPSVTITSPVTSQPVASITATLNLTGTLLVGQATATGQVLTATPTLARPTRTPTPTNTPLPSRTPTPTQGAPFVIDTQEQVCDRSAGEALLLVEAFDAAGQPVSGVEIVVVWETGENHFFTGLKPEVNPGFADFQMTPGESYTVRLTQGGLPLVNIEAFECETGAGERYYGNWHLEFVQP